jgi:RHS repeat-associated protein
VPGLEEPLVATGPTTLQEDKDLDAAIAAYSAPTAAPASDFADDAQPLLAYLSEHPSSAWNAALLTNIGIGYYHAGYFSRAFAAWQRAWEIGRDATTPQAKIMVDRAVAELARMHARLGHQKELEGLFADIGQRPISGSATEMIQGAHEGLWKFEHDPGVAYLCGPKALEKLLIALKANPDQIKIADDARSGPHGFSLTQLAALADRTNLNYKVIHREAGQPVPVPSIINWNVHHFAAITSKEDALYQVLDPTFGGSSGALLSAKAIDAESSGYFLVPASVVDANPRSGWRVVNADSDEAHAVYGMGDTGNDLPGTVMPTDTHSCPGDTPQVSGQKSSCTPQEKGMTAANVVMMPVSLNLVDTPVGYRPQKGPSALVTLFYNQREDQQPANFSFSNVGPKWTFSWLAYVQDDPSNPGNGVSRYASGGGGIVYQANTYNRSTGTFVAETYDNAQLMRVPPTGTLNFYQRNLPDGSTEIYGLSNGAQRSPRIVFLTAIVDPAGNTTTLNYDSQFRLTSVTDAMGRSTTFTYGLASYPFLITRITDAFGRYSQLTYDGSQRLASITDPIGITSTVTYSQSVPTFITSLTTPYGVTRFSEATPTGDPQEGNTRALTLTDPLGYTDFFYFYEKANFIHDSDPSNTVPTGMNTINQYLEYRNTYYYDRHAFNYPGAVTLNPDGTIRTEDPYNAHITHWVHDQLDFPNLTGRIPESIKPPLEDRTWYNYPHQPQSYQSGYLDRPTAAGRVIDPSSHVQQLSKATYNGGDGSFGGRPTSITDAVGRETKFTYASNNIDLLTAQQNTASGFATIATFSNYNNQHEPQSYTGADGRTWNYSYNAAGQLATVTDPNSGVTTYNYDGIGRLSTVQNANRQTVLTLTYDSADRVRTRTDSEGYTLTYDYDNLDRVTRITYPDGSTDLYDWSFQSGPLQGTPSLDLRKHSDRLGRVTTYDYDADRRLISVTEPISSGVNRTTSYDYYENGVLKDIFDANGNVTHWEIDLESRPISKTYAYGASNAETEIITYENTTSRVKSLTDALSQMKNYSYGLDDRLSGITYINAANPTPNVIFGYDPYFPRLTSMVDGTGTTSYTYTPIGSDGALQLASEQGPFGNDTISYGYDPLGRMSARNIAGGNEAFAYDAISRPISHSTPLGVFTYHYLGQTDQVMSRSLPNGIGTTWSYDSNHNDRRLIGITNSGITRSYTFGYRIPGGGGANNPYDILSSTAVAAPGHPFHTQNHAYGYDLSDRLLFDGGPAAVSSDNHSYAYDLLDSPTTVVNGGNIIHATYNDLNEISTWDGNNYFYDLNGNTLSGDGTRSYKWDAENRLVEIDYVGSNAKTQFGYDALNRRIITIETAANGGMTITHNLWCASKLCQVRDNGDNLLRRDLEEGQFNVTTSQKLIFMPDQLGSVRDVLDATTGSLMTAYDYAPYGAIARSYGSAPTDYRYAGLFYNAASALNLATYRAYDPPTARWLSRDPLVGSLPPDSAHHPNLVGQRRTFQLTASSFYGYVAANPLSRIDHQGLWQITVFGGLLGGFEVTFGYNGGQLNVGIYAGVAEGGGVEIDPEDSGCHRTGFVPDIVGQAEIIAGSGFEASTEVNPLDPLNFRGENSGEVTYTDPQGVEWQLWPNDGPPKPKTTISVGEGGFLGGGGKIYF